jgi:hypothetical protein
MYRTEVIKQLGGFDVRFAVGCDYNLQDRVRKAGYKWITDKTVVSDHIREGVLQSVKHTHELSKRVTCTGPILDALQDLLFSPIRAFDIATKKACPQALLIYPYWRLIMLKSVLNANKKQQNQTTPPLPLKKPKKGN